MTSHDPRSRDVTAPAWVPELKGFDCVDHDPIERWVPEGEAVLYWLVLHIGVPGEPGADLFTVPVANHAGLHDPEWKQRADRSKSPIVVDPYSWQGVIDEVDRCLQAAAGWDWATVRAKLRERFAWEYEGMG